MKVLHSMAAIGAAALFVLAVPTAPAQAMLVNSSTPAFTVHDDISTSLTGLNKDLLADVTFSNFTFSPTGTVTFTMSIANQTDPACANNCRLTAVGFNIDPDASGIGDNSTMFSTFLADTFPSAKKVDVCASTGTNCAGGGGGDELPGITNTFTVTLTGLPANTTTLDIGANGTGDEIVDFKFQTGSGSFENSCTIGATCGPPTTGGGTTVNEPASLALLGFGLIGLGMVRRHNSA